jgi:hypothetical protein
MAAARGCWRLRRRPGRGVRDDVVRIVGRGDDDIDPEALATLGIDLEAVRERVERAFGPAR